ncbi:MAG: putative O-glycosylation ligase, exosortase A system-associated [Pseudomonadota bacterium]
MRDIVFLALLPLMLYAMFKRPFIALGMWIWTAMFFPNAWVYGPAQSLRYNLMFTGITILGYIVLKEKPKVSWGKIGGLVFLFFLWTAISSVTTIGALGTTGDILFRFFKVVMLFVFVVLIVDKKLHIDFFLWCVVLSIGFYGSLEALKFVASGGGHKIEGFAGHVLGDRNELALSFVMILPICAYLLGEYGRESKWVRFGLLGLMGLLVTAVVGTQSRGGLISILGLAAYMFMKSNRKGLLGTLAVILVVALSALVSEEWLSRMDTIGEAKQDASFMGRVVAWKMSFIMAAQNPFFGGGFKALETPVVWLALSQDFNSYPFFYTADAFPDPYFARAAHSVYFQVLGEHGFVGLAIYLMMVGTAFMKVRRVAAKVKRYKGPEWIATLATMLQLVIFAFCLGGAALSFAYFELVYAVFGLILVLETRILPRFIDDKPVAPPKKYDGIPVPGRPSLHRI